MFIEVAAFLARQAELFGEGRFAEMCRSHAYPQPVQMEDDLVVLRTPEEHAAGMAAHRASLAARGFTRFAARVGAVELPRAGRFRAWVRWSHEGTEGLVENGSETVYYLRRLPDGRLAVEMTEYTRLALGDAELFEPARARTA